MAAVELWKTSNGHRVAGQWAVWLAFAFGIVLSLCVNVALAPKLNAFAIMVAACPPPALLLSVELVNRALAYYLTGSPKAVLRRVRSWIGLLEQTSMAVKCCAAGGQLLVALNRLRRSGDPCRNGDALPLPGRQSSSCDSTVEATCRVVRGNPGVPTEGGSRGKRLVEWLARRWWLA